VFLLLKVTMVVQVKALTPQKIERLEVVVALVQ
jgi:hypothetical protein